jgi:hypothetical protein
MQTPGSESARVWNTFYPLAGRGIASQTWFGLPRLWGSAQLNPTPDVMTPYFWGYRIDGQLLPGLGAAAEAVAGREDRLEVDLILRGEHDLVAVEAKGNGAPGRCGRFESETCPEVHGGGTPCRYWEEAPAAFTPLLDFGPRPTPHEADRPPCSVHYQLARTLVLVTRLAEAGGQVPHVCLLLPKRRWPVLRSTWIDFSERVRDDAQWTRLSVVAWEDAQRMPS